MRLPRIEGFSRTVRPGIGPAIGCAVDPGPVEEQVTPLREWAFASNCAGSLFAGLAVDGLPEKIGVAVVPGVLLDHVTEDPAEAGRPAVASYPAGALVEAASRQCVGDS